MKSKFFGYSKLKNLKKEIIKRRDKRREREERREKRKRKRRGKRRKKLLCWLSALPMEGFIRIGFSISIVLWNNK